MHDLTAFTMRLAGRPAGMTGVAEWGGWRWASDGHMAVREPGPKEPKPDDFPDLRDFFRKLPPLHEMLPLPPLDGKTISADCDACPRETCHTCGGSGECRCRDCDGYHTCGRCDGEGSRRWACEACESTGEIEVPRDQRVDGLLFGGVLLGRIHDTFPDASYAVRGTPQNPRLYFRAPGGVEGLLCGLKERP